MHAHWRDDWQSGIRLWQGHVAEPAALIPAVIVHGLAIAVLATGAIAVTREINTASNVRCKVIAISDSYIRIT
jgi:hypothetical protein